MGTKVFVVEHDIKQHNHMIVQCPSIADESIRAHCFKIGCPHTLPHEHTEACKNVCETVVSVIM
jgi:hypothetical protein